MKKKCYAFFVTCNSCSKISMHLSFEKILIYESGGMYSSSSYLFIDEIDIDSKIFYSVPTSFFTLDSRIPREIRELINEGEECLRMNLLTGASACVRKAIYELLIIEDATGDNYEGRIKSLKTKHKEIDESAFDVLSHIQDMTSDKIHEQSWDLWNSGNLVLIIESLKSILYEIFVIPEERKERAKKILQLKEKVDGKKK
ncbi:MAG: hypothetical protein PWQ55_1695 [Chloroflexota bacterium]|nr:hypothetical protein [Chloroflexota bacterium]